MFRKSTRADPLERSRELPGDDLIMEPIASLTQAITIQRSPRGVWPWLAQMGAGRAGWYSYDFIDNGRNPSATRIVPELQNIAVGTVFPALPGVTDGFVIVAYEPQHSLVLSWRRSDDVYLTTWAFVLEEIEPGCTRLIVRARGGPGYDFHGLPMWLTKLIVPPGHFVMQRKQLLGIARRAEKLPRRNVVAIDRNPGRSKDAA